MRAALKAISILAMLSSGSVCFAQDAPVIQTAPSAASTIQPADDQTDNTKPSAPTVPIPPVGDPLFAPVAISGAPQTLDQRFRNYAVITFGPRGLVTPMLGAGLSMLNPPSGYPKEWRQGMSAFGRN